jgi:ABC-2 type transport system permease protein
MDNEKYCKFCGAKNPPYAAFCDYCGSPLSAPPAPFTESKRARSAEDAGDATVVGAARPSRRAAAPVVASGKTAEASPPAFVFAPAPEGETSSVGTTTEEPAPLRAIDNEKYCNYCGAKNTPYVAFCDDCGSPLSAPSAPFTESERARSAEDAGAGTVVGAARPSRRAAAPVVASGKTAEASPPRAFVRRLRAQGSAVVGAARSSRWAAKGVNVKAINVAYKGIRQTLRDRVGFVLILGLPVLLILIFSFGFGSTTFLSGGTLPHEVVVVNNDAGVMVAGTNNTTRYVNYGSNFTQVLTKATAENSSTKLFDLKNASQGEAENLLASRSIDALITIPQNFSSAFVSMVNNSTRTAITSSIGQQALATAANSSGSNSLNPVTTTPGASGTLPAAGNVTSALIIEGDSGYANFASAQALVTGIFDQYKNSIIANAAARAAPGGAATITDNAIPVELHPIAGTQSYTLFDYMVPGLIVFALLLQVSGVASSLARDVEAGILDRLKLSNVRAFDLLSGTFLTWSIITVAQVVILIVFAIALGYHHQGDFSSLGLAVVIGVIAGMASISLALIIASFTKNYLQALSASAMIAVPLGFMAGAFIPLPAQSFEFLGMTYSVYDLLPWTHAVSSLRGVLTYGTGFSGFVVVEMGWLVVLTAIMFVVGVVCYSKVRLRVEK